MKDSYPLSFDQTEKQRLEQQTELLSDDKFLEQIKGAKRCLEIGCGVGANLKGIRSANPAISYVGIDVSETAIDIAKSTYNDLNDVEFLVMNGMQLQLPDNSFDIVFCRLVLWGAGREWPRILDGAHKVLRPGGLFYSYEPYDKFLNFSPEKPDAMNLIRKWQKRVMADGLNPFVGSEVFGALKRTGFTLVATRMITKLTLGEDKEAYQKSITNLRNIFTRNGPEFVGLEKDVDEWNRGLRQFEEFTDDSILLETYFATEGRKS